MNKRLITLVILLLFVVVVLIVCFTVLTIRDVTVDFQGDSGSYTETQILDAADIDFGKIIFSVSEQEVLTKIQNAYPSVKVLSIERKFPDKIIIHVTARHPVLAIGVAGTDNVVVVDREFTVLEVLASSELATRLENGSLNGIVTTDVTISQANAVPGVSLLDSKATDVIILQNVVVAFENMDVLNADFVSLVKSVSYASGSVTVEMRAGVKAVITDITSLGLRVNEAYSWYCNMAASSDSSEVLRTTSGYVRYDTLSKKFVWTID